MSTPSHFATKWSRLSTPGPYSTSQVRRSRNTHEAMSVGPTSPVGFQDSKNCARSVSRATTIVEASRAATMRVSRPTRSSIAP